MFLEAFVFLIDALGKGFCLFTFLLGCFTCPSFVVVVVCVFFEFIADGLVILGEFVIGGVFGLSLRFDLLLFSYLQFLLDGSLFLFGEIFILVFSRHVCSL